jgi:hypothetical protein
VGDPLAYLELTRSFYLLFVKVVQILVLSFLNEHILWQHSGESALFRISSVQFGGVMSLELL